MFDIRPKERLARPAVEPVDQALAVAITEHPHLERQLRVIRQLHSARTPIITADRIVEHAGGHRSEAIEAGEQAAECGWICPYNQRADAWCPVLKAKTLKRK